MEEFIKALVSDKKSDVIPDEMDFYKPLIGDWNFDYYYNL